MVRMVLYIQEGSGLNLNTEISYPEDFMMSLKPWGPSKSPQHSTAWTVQLLSITSSQGISHAELTETQLWTDRPIYSAY